MASYLTAGFSVACFAEGLSKILSCRDFMDNYSPLCAFVTIFEVFCLEIVTLVYHWRNIFPGLGQIVTPGGILFPGPGQLFTPGDCLQTRQYLKNL